MPQRIRKILSVFGGGARAENECDIVRSWKLRVYAEIWEKLGLQAGGKCAWFEA